MFKSALKELVVAGLVERRCWAAAGCAVLMGAVLPGSTGAFRATATPEAGPCQALLLCSMVGVGLGWVVSISYAI